MAPALIEEVKIRLDGSSDPFTCELVKEDETGVIMLWRAESAFVAGDYRLPAGSVTTAFYWRGRRHNLYRPVRPGGEIICHRMDIIEPPTFEPGRVTFRDLVLDILVPPDGGPQLQDEDELHAAVSQGLLSPREAGEILVYAQSLLVTAPEVIAEAQTWLEGGPSRR